MSFYRDLKNDCMFCKRLAKYNELVILVCKLTEWFWLWYCYQWTVNTRKNGIQLPSNLIQGWYFGSSMFRAIFRNLKQIVLVHCSGSGAGCRTLRVGKRTFPENGLCCQEKNLWSEIFASYYYHYTVLRHSFTMDLLSRCAVVVGPKLGLDSCKARHSCVLITV